MVSMGLCRLTLFSFSTLGTLYVAMVAMLEELKPFGMQGKGGVDLEAFDLYDALASNGMLLVAIEQVQKREAERRTWRTSSF